VADQAEIRPEISWADLPVLIRAGNVAIESMGFRNVRVAGGPRGIMGARRRPFYWGPEVKWLADERYTGDRDLQNPSPLCKWVYYVNPEGPNGNRNPPHTLAAARGLVMKSTCVGSERREEENRFALIVGGHTSARNTAPAMRHWWAQRRKQPQSREGLGWKKQVWQGKAA